MLVTAINSALGRKLAASRMRSETAKKAPIEHYPAPYALIDLWEQHGGDNAAMQKAEIASFARLLGHRHARNLVRVFFLREKLKDLTGGKWAGKRVHVIGAGAMGGDIAAWCAWHGLTVTLADMKTEPLGAAIKRAARALRQDRPQGHDDPRCARPADARPARRRRAHRRPGDRGGAGNARAQAEGLCGDRAEDAAGRDPRHQHVEHSARRTARRAGAARAARRPALLQSGVAHAAGRGGEPRPGVARRRCGRRARSSASSTGCRRR